MARKRSKKKALKRAVKRAGIQQRKARRSFRRSRKRATKVLFRHSRTLRKMRRSTPFRMVRRWRRSSRRTIRAVQGKQTTPKRPRYRCRARLMITWPDGTGEVRHVEDELEYQRIAAEVYQSGGNVVREDY